MKGDLQIQRRDSQPQETTKDNVAVGISSSLSHGPNVDEEMGVDAFSPAAGIDAATLSLPPTGIASPGNDRHQNMLPGGCSALVEPQTTGAVQPVAAAKALSDKNALVEHRQSVASPTKPPTDHEGEAVRLWEATRGTPRAGARSESPVRRMTIEAGTPTTVTSLVPETSAAAAALSTTNEGQANGDVKSHDLLPVVTHATLHPTVSEKERVRPSRAPHAAHDVMNEIDARMAMDGSPGGGSRQLGQASASLRSESMGVNELGVNELGEEIPESMATTVTAGVSLIGGTRVSPGTHSCGGITSAMGGASTPGPWCLAPANIPARARTKPMATCQERQRLAARIQCVSISGSAAGPLTAAIELHPHGISSTNGAANGLSPTSASFGDTSDVLGFSVMPSHSASPKDGPCHGDSRFSTTTRETKTAPLCSAGGSTSLYEGAIDTGSGVLSCSRMSGSCWGTETKGKTHDGGAGKEVSPAGFLRPEEEQSLTVRIRRYAINTSRYINVEGYSIAHGTRPKMPYEKNATDRCSAFCPSSSPIDPISRGVRELDGAVSAIVCVPTENMIHACMLRHGSDFTMMYLKPAPYK